MYQHFKSVNRSWAPIAREVISLLLWVTQRLLRMLFRRPMIDVLALLFALWIITSFLGRVLVPQPVLLQPAAVFEGR
jgi:hypothetical protein